MKNTRAKDIMTKNPIFAREEDFIKDIIIKLDKNRLTGLPVINEKDEIIGIITDEDLAIHNLNPHAPQALTLLGSVIYLENAEEFNENLKKICAQKAKDLMSEAPATHDENDTLDEIIATMQKENVNLIPITKSHHLTGVISYRDIIHAMAKK